MGSKLRRSGRFQRQEFIAEPAGVVTVTRAERLANAPFRKIRQMDSVMTPPNPIVIPEVMVRVLRIGSEREFLIAHVAFPLRQNASGSESKTAALSIRTAV
jgi:hypothetical protein